MVGSRFVTITIETSWATRSSSFRTRTRKRHSPASGPPADRMVTVGAATSAEGSKVAVAPEAPGGGTAVHSKASVPPVPVAPRGSEVDPPSVTASQASGEPVQRCPTVSGSPPDTSGAPVAWATDTVALAVPAWPHGSAAVATTS